MPIFLTVLAIANLVAGIFYYRRIPSNKNKTRNYAASTKVVIGIMLVVTIAGYLLAHLTHYIVKACKEVCEADICAQQSDEQETPVPHYTFKADDNHAYEYRNLPKSFRYFGE